MNVLTDKELLQDISAGNKAAFNILFSRYWKPLFSFVYQLCKNEEDTKDIVQDVFVYMWNHREQVFAENSILPYLNTIAKNAVMSSFRKNKVRLNGAELLIADLQQDVRSDEQLLLNEMREGIETELSKMPANMRSCFQLSRFEDLSIREIAAKLGLSEQTVKNNISEALKRLRVSVAERSILYLTLIIAGAIT
ncbi:RNA polymerase sigma factor [Desertivirga brevis]|uniref:RNA polymerase sigma factor n=1 Tax=Desertivirga brevis TaxID=2810310 RepID=UPI001A973B62|nr:RNA polymerase sigma-70 factor [Pedobacter sp. SYSU D00873]